MSVTTRDLKPPLRPRRIPALVATAALLSPLGVATLAAAPTALANTPVQVWQTTQDRADQLTKKSDVTLGSSGSGNVTININPNQTYQTMTGFGGSFTDSATVSIGSLNSSQRSKLLSDLFSYDNGIGLSWLRQPLGATDFNRDTNFYTYQDAGPGTPVNVNRDNDALNLIKAAKSYNPSISVAGAPWSAPAWMKVHPALVNGNSNTNQLKIEHEGDYAEYLKNVVQAYKDKGVDMDYISIQNEPHFTPGGYPAMYMSQWTQANVINELGWRLNNSGLGNTKILGWEHNWNNTGYAEFLVNGWSSQYVAGTAWHCYEGSAGAQSTVHYANSSKGTFFTECSGIESSNRANTFKDTLWYHSTNYTFPAVRNWSKTISFWNLALNENNGPVQGACTSSPCTGIVTVNNNGTYTRNAGYYVLGHFSKFVKPGAVRIGSSDTTSSISNAAFQNPDGSRVLVVHNGGGSNSIKVNVDGQTFGYHVPENSLVTFAWGGNGNWGGTGGVSGGPDGSPGQGGNDQDPPDVPGTAGAITGLANKCVDVRSGGETKANGTVVQLHDCNGSIAQRWIIADDGTIRVRGKCLEVNGTGNGAQAYIWDCDGKNTQQWTISGQLIKASGGRCLDVPDSNSSNGTQLKLWDCYGDANQRWNPPVSNPVGNTSTIRDSQHNKCVDVAGGSTTSANGTAVQLYQCNNTVAQNWTFAPDGSIRFGSKCLDVSAPVGNGSQTQIWECTGRANQRWQRDGNLLRVVDGNRCLDLPNGSSSNATRLQVWDCFGAGNQQWNV